MRKVITTRDNLPILPPPNLPFSCNWTQLSLQSQRIVALPQFCLPHLMSASDRWKLNSSQNSSYRGLRDHFSHIPQIIRQQILMIQNLFLIQPSLTSSFDTILVQTTITFTPRQQKSPNWLLIPVTPLYSLFSTQQPAILKTKSDHAVPPTLNSLMAFHSLSYPTPQEKVKIKGPAFPEKRRSSKSFCLPNLREVQVTGET